MVVAVVAVAVVQTAVHQVVEMVAVRYQRVATALVAALAGDRGADVGVGRAHGNDMLVIVALVGEVQVAIVEIVHVALVQNAYMAAVLAMHMRVVSVDEVSHAMLLKSS